MRNKATKKNMDLGLRRYGNKLYSKAEKSGGSDGGGDSADINTILDNISIKDDLLTKLQAIDYTNQDPDYGILTDLTFDDVFNDYNDFIKSLLYREETPAIPGIVFSQDNGTIRLLVNRPGVMCLRLESGNYIYYVYIVDENNNIEIYAMKQESSPKQ